MVSSATEGQVKKLRKAGYLSKDIAHRLPEKGQLLPTPRPHERVVFLPHFLLGLGFPLHPFVRGLMFYYGLDFHDLAPNFILNISVFIVLCEAFLRVRPHFGLWLKTFNVKPKVVHGSQAECGGAMAGKIANVLWFEGSLVETLKGWQARWFVRTPTQCHIDLACNTSYHFAASRTVFPRVSPYLCPRPFAPFGTRI